jgi:hypothetical protein
MDGVERKVETRAIVIVGLAYASIGVGLGYLAGIQNSEQRVFAVRLSAWIVSAALFTGHFLYQHFRLRSSSLITALNVSLAVAIGAFLLAVGAIANTLIRGQGNIGRLALALVLWPLMTSIPALVVSFISAKILALVQSRSTRNA